MWKQEKPIQPVTPQVTSTTSSDRPAGSSANQDVLIGKSIVVKGELHASEDLTIEGQVEGKIMLKQHALTIGTHGRIRADVFAKSVVILGEVIGNIEATDKVAISAKGTVDGDIKASRIAIAEGVELRGGIDIQQGLQGNRTRSEPRPGSGPRHRRPHRSRSERAPSDGRVGNLGGSP